VKEQKLLAEAQRQEAEELLAELAEAAGQ